MLPLHPIVVRANDHTRRISTLDPIHDTQHDAMVRLVDPVGTPTSDGALTELPCTRSPNAVSHAGYHEQPIERVHLVSTSSFACARNVVIRKRPDLPRILDACLKMELT
jgi:hypothetical protein